MALIKILVLAAAVCLCSRASKVGYEVQRVYLKSVQCNSSATFVQNMTCGVTSYNRTYATGTFIAYTKMPLYNVSVSGIRFRR